MRLTIILLLATTLVAAGGVFYVNARVGGVDLSPEAAPHQAASEPAISASAAKPQPNHGTIIISGCYDTKDHCRCIDQLGRKIAPTEISDVDCRVMLKIAPK